MLKNFILLSTALHLSSVGSADTQNSNTHGALSVTATTANNYQNTYYQLSRHPTRKAATIASIKACKDLHKKHATDICWRKALTDTCLAIARDEFDFVKTYDHVNLNYAKEKAYDGCIKASPTQSNCHIVVSECFGSTTNPL